MPRVQGGSGQLKLLGGLSLRDAVRLYVEIGLEQIGPLKSILESLAVETAVAIVARRKIDYSAHSYLSLKL